MKNILRHVLAFLGFAFLVVEEVFWIVGRHAGVILAKIPVWQSVERLVQVLPAWGVAVVFLIPMGLLLPIKMAALYFMSSGHVFSGVTIIILAKIGGTAISAKLFGIAKPKLLTLIWFARTYGFITAKLAIAHAWLHSLRWWIRMKSVIRLAKIWIRARWQRWFARAA